ncbi:MAG: hypothetical protein U5K69_03285 [Balneolaceae bacterium]|nr:hypothetical protein [Balneolaceae bacterium]
MQETEEMLWTSEVKEVLGYGSSTPPLGIGKQIDIDVTTYFKNTNENPREMAEREELICVIRHRELRQGSTASSWSLVKVFEQ